MELLHQLALVGCGEQTVMQPIAVDDVVRDGNIPTVNQVLVYVLVGIEGIGELLTLILTVFLGGRKSQNLVGHVVGENQEIFLPVPRVDFLVDELIGVGELVKHFDVGFIPKIFLDVVISSDVLVNPYPVQFLFSRHFLLRLRLPRFRLLLIIR